MSNFHIHPAKLDIASIRKDFPALNQEIYGGKQLVYLDSAATSQKPQVVMDRLMQYYQMENANVHRGVHYLSQLATDHYEGTRTKIQQLINAKHQHEIIYTSGTTGGINLVAFSFGEKYIQAGDEIIISAMEHHSNIVPWQLLCERKGATLKVIPMDDTGTLDLEAYGNLLNKKTKLVAVVHISNSLGTINPIKKMVQMAHELDIPVLVDGAQAMPHSSVDVQDLDVDFYAFSGHKMFGPTGFGCLYGKEKWLEAMPPFLGGGDMIETVSFEKSTYAALPHKFEAGTPNIADAIAMGAAIDYIQNIGFEAIEAYEQELLVYAQQRLSEIEGIRFYGTSDHKASVISFLIGDIHPYDAGTILDRLGIAIRTGHHCTQTVMRHFQIPGTMRASFAFYNTKEEIDILVDGLQEVKKMFQ